MGTPMAVNFANLFMSKFETEMLHKYETNYGKRPLSWIRYIDDIFFIWTGDIKSLNDFLSYCNSFARENNFKSKITFTSEFSTENVVFLDTKVKLHNGQLITELYCKPTATHTYLHRHSDHPSHTIRSNPLSQFIRIRRICSLIQDYRRHASDFIRFYVNRGYSEHKLVQMATDVENRDRRELLESATTKRKSSNERVPFVINWHTKFRGLSSLLRRNYESMITDHPELKETFPEPPIVSYRRNPNIRSTLVRSQKKILKTKGPSVRCTAKNTKKRGRPCKLCNHMGQKDCLTNSNNGRTSYISGGSCQSKNVVYAAECVKHKKLYVGFTSTALSQRFNKHRYDAGHDPTSTELGKHFYENKECNFDRDLRVHVLEKVEGGLDELEHHENLWMTRLGSREPFGLNSMMNELGRLYFSLYGNCK